MTVMRGCWVGLLAIATAVAACFTDPGAGTGASAGSGDTSTTSPTSSGGATPGTTTSSSTTGDPTTTSAATTTSVASTSSDPATTSVASTSTDPLTTSDPSTSTDPSTSSDTSSSEASMSGPGTPDLPPACLDLYGNNPCGQCVCSECAELAEDCAANAGCATILQCIVETMCNDTLDCYMQCKQVVDQNGGLMGESASKALKLGNCAQANCPGPC